MNRQIWEKAVDFHGHTCGGLALGVRAAMEAQKRFGRERCGDEEIVCITENDACGVDGIQSVLGCTLGKGNLIYYGTGEFAFSFFDRSTGDSFRLMAKDKKAGLHGSEYSRIRADGASGRSIRYRKAKGRTSGKSQISQICQMQHMRRGGGRDEDARA